MISIILGNSSIFQPVAYEYYLSKYFWERGVHGLLLHRISQCRKNHKQSWVLQPSYSGEEMFLMSTLGLMFIKFNMQTSINVFYR